MNLDGAGRRVHDSAGRRLLEALLAARGESGSRVWTLERLARVTRSKTSTISALATGVTKVPSLELAAALHEQCGIDWRSWLFQSAGREGDHDESQRER